MKYAAKTYIGIPYKRLVTPGEILTEEEASALDIPGMLERGAVVEITAKESAEGGAKDSKGRPQSPLAAPAGAGETSLSPAGDISPFRGEGNSPEAGPEGVQGATGKPPAETPEGGQGGERKAPRKKAAKKPAPAPDEKPVTQEAALSALTLDDRDMEESPAPAKKGGRKR